MARLELTAEVGAAREAVWLALNGDLAQRGEHVTVLEQSAPKRLRLQVGNGPGERLLLGYELVAPDAANTVIHAFIEPAGVRYRLKKLLTLGAVDRAYLDALAVGLQNLQAHFEPESAAGQDRDED